MTDIVGRIGSGGTNMATVAYESGTPNAPELEEPKKYRKVWKCGECGRMHEHWMVDLSAADVKCDYCGHVNRITYVARDTFERLPDLKSAELKIKSERIRKRWVCVECGLEHDWLMQLGATHNVKCDRCDTTDKVTVPKYMPTKKLIRNEKICAECGFKHTYDTYEPKTCQGCGTTMGMSKARIEIKRTGPPFHNKPMTFSERNGLKPMPKVTINKAGKCESIW